jgi:type IV pilus assembly protein PilN
MLVEINLLPKKEPRNLSLLIILGTFIGLILIGAALLFWQINEKKQELVNIENQIQLTNDILEAERTKLADFQSAGSVQELENAIKWAKDQPYNLVYVLRQLTKVLPERGFITEFKLAEGDIINLIVQFDTKSEAAYYLNYLLNYEWIEEAVITEAKAGDWKIMNNNTSVSDDEITESAKKDYYPRYYAEYELRLNIAELKQAYSLEMEKSAERNNGEEEGGGST